MHDVLGELVAVFGAAIAVVLLLTRLRLPTIAGFIVAGALLGPSGLGLIRERAVIELLAEVGVVLLLFTIGLEFSLAELRRIWRVVALGGGLQVGLTTLAVLGIAAALGAPPARGLFLGFLVALSSTAIVLRALAERGETDAPHGRLIVGALLFQDLCVVPMMLLIPVLAGRELRAWYAISALLVAAALVAITLWLARKAVPRLLGLVAATQQRDLFVLAVLLVCSGIAWLTSLAGLSLALGAFLAGVVLADSEYGHQALADVLPFRDVLSSLFFISMGLLLDLRVLLAEPLRLGALVAALLVGKTLLAALAGVVMRFPLRVAVLSGVALAQVGEFSFVLARLGASEGLLGPAEMPLFLAAAVITMLVTPVAVRFSPHLAAGAARLRGLERVLGVSSDEAGPGAEPPDDHVLILGYGVGGQLLAEALHASGLPYVIVDVNAGRVRAARARGEPALYGDVTAPEILERAGIKRARHVAILINDPEAIRRCVRLARRLAPDVPILVRTRYLADVGPLQAAGASEVVAQEFEASLEVLAGVLQAAAVPHNVIGERVRQARHRGTLSRRSLSVPSRRMGEVPELAALGIESFLIRDGSWIAGRSVAEAHLRTRTGASLVAVGRAGELAGPLDPSQPLRAGDILYLVGETSHLAVARELLERGTQGPTEPPGPQ